MSLSDYDSAKNHVPAFIERLYRERFRKDRPDVVLSLEHRAHLHQQKKTVGRSV